MKQQYRLSLDDNILVLKALAAQRPPSLFENRYLAMLRGLHRDFGTKIHLNLYYQTAGFCLADMPARYREEWQANADWLRLSFHALQDAPPDPYKTASYAALAHDCTLVQSEIRRFAGEEALSCSTTLHYCTATKQGCDALYDCGVRNLVGLFYDFPSYHMPPETGDALRSAPYIEDAQTHLRFFANDMVLNNLESAQILPILEAKQTKRLVEIMIHEQYFHTDFPFYQPDFEHKLRTALQWLTQHSFAPAFLEEIE